MFNAYESLTEMIDHKIKPIYALANELNMEAEDLYEELCEGYLNARAAGTVICDSDGISFEMEFASIDLIPNRDMGSKFPYYLRYVLKTSSRQGADEQTIPNNLDCVRMSSGTLRLFNKFATGMDEEPSQMLVLQLKQGYLSAKENSLLIPNPNGFTFFTGITTPNGERINAAIKPSQKDDSFWVLNYVGYEKESYATAFRQFAVQGNYLQDLASMARAEKWFSGENGNDLNILRNYIAYTYYRLRHENKICFSANKNFAAFHTGLVSESYEDIYICFKPTELQDGPEWKYVGLCEAARGSLGKQLIQQFKPLPKPANYIESMEDVVFDARKPLYLDLDHILIDRLERLPLSFLESSLSADPESRELLRQLGACQEYQKPLLYDRLRERVCSSRYAYDTLRHGLESVVNKAVKRLRWNYRLAIPCYYPKRNSMSMLLPMCFHDDNDPQAALVVHLTDSGNYLGHTLLSMDLAYVNARLVSSQESSWLVA